MKILFVFCIICYINMSLDNFIFSPYYTMENMESKQTWVNETSHSMGWCPSCSHFRAHCWICKIIKIAFGLLIFLALLKFVCSGCYGGMGGRFGHGFDGGQRKMIMMMSGGNVNGTMMQYRKWPWIIKSRFYGADDEAVVDWSWEILVK